MLLFCSWTKSSTLCIPGLLTTASLRNWNMQYSSILLGAEKSQIKYKRNVFFFERKERGAEFPFEIVLLRIQVGCCIKGCFLMSKALHNWQTSLSGFLMQPWSGARAPSVWDSQQPEFSPLSPESTNRDSGHDPWEQHVGSKYYVLALSTPLSPCSRQRVSQINPASSSPGKSKPRACSSVHAFGLRGPFVYIVCVNNIYPAFVTPSWLT